MSAADRWTGVVLALLILVVWVAALAARPLFDPDEGRYAEIPREMLVSGDWLVPRLNGLLYLEKPPLQYWATAASLKLFGRSELAARLYTALSALGTLCAVWLLGTRLWGAAAGWRGTAVLASMLLFLALGQLLTLDMSLTLYMTWSLVAFVLAQRASMPAARGWMLIAWAAAALGVLTKGLESAVIPAAVLVLYSILARDRRPWGQLEFRHGVPLFLLISVPWFWLMARRVPDFLRFFFVHEHLSRYLTPSADRQEPAWYFGAVFLLGSLPWTLSALRVMFTGYRRAESPPAFDAARFLWLWVLFVGVFFSLSDSKLIPYVLPALPALALLIGRLPEEAWRADLKWTALLTVIAALLCAGASFYGPRLLAPTERNACYVALAPSLARVALLLAITGVYVHMQGYGRTMRPVLLLAAGWCLSACMLARAASAVAPIYSGIVLARSIPAPPREVPVYSVGTYVQTLPFYWNRTVTLVHYRGEFDYGLEHDSSPVLTLPEFMAAWRAAPEAYAVMERTMSADLSRGPGGLPLEERARDVRRVLVARR